MFSARAAPFEHICAPVSRMQAAVQVRLPESGDATCVIVGGIHVWPYAQTTSEDGTVRARQPCFVVIIRTPSHQGTRPGQSWLPNNNVDNIKTMLTHIATSEELQLRCL